MDWYPKPHLRCFKLAARFLFLKTNMPVFKKFYCWHKPTFLVRCNDHTYLRKHKIDTERKSMQKSCRMSSWALIWTRLMGGAARRGAPWGGAARRGAPWPMGGGRPPRGLGGIHWGGDTPKDYTKPRQTIQSPGILDKAPETLYKAPTDYIKPRQTIPRPRKTIPSPRKTK